MYTCEQSREVLWDLLYGLLEAEQSQALRDHLSACPACRTALERAEADQRLVARAARWVESVPPFQVPETELTTAPEAPTAPRATLPLRRPAARRPFRSWLAAAAAVLFLVGGTYGLYRYGLAEREGALTAAGGAVAQIDQQRQTNHDLEIQAEKQTLAVLRGQQLHISVLGPSHCEPGVACEYRVQTRNLDGRPAPAHVTVRLVNPANGKALAEIADLDCQGEQVVKLPPLPADASMPTARLEVSVRGDRDEEILRQLVGTTPRYLTHLALDRLVYRPGDLIFFRSVTLDRVTLRPPEKPVMLHYTLLGHEDKPIYRVSGLSREGGIGGGEFPIVEALPDGAYTLVVEDAQMLSTPVRRTLYIERGRKPGAKFNPPTASARGPTTVEFFPEGGNLVAGVENRVYVRVRTPAGRPAGLDGVLVDGHGKEIVRVQADVRLTANQAVGVFAFTPRLGEEYRLLVSVSSGLKDVPPLPRPQKSGLVLSVPTGVTHAGEPVRVRLTHADLRERDLVVAVSCRGRLVKEQPVTAPPGSREVGIALPEEAAGILRVTVFEEQGGQLWPVAERLIYRVPAQRLVLTADTDRKHRAGDRVKVRVRSTTESGAAAMAWLLAVVVDEQAAGDETSLPAHFYLTGQLRRPEELEQADVLLRDGPEAARALDLFLGTQRWRRFTAPESSGPPALAAAMPAMRGALPPAGTALVLLDNSAAVAKRYESLRDARLAQRRRDYDADDERLQADRAHALTAMAGAREALDAYRTRTRDYGRLGLGVATLTLFVIGCLSLILALARSILARGATRPYFATAFAALLLCVVTFFTFSGPQTDDLTGSGSGVASTYKGKDLPPLPQVEGSAVRPVPPLAVALADPGRPGRTALPTEDAVKVAQAQARPAVPGLGSEKRFAQASAWLRYANPDQNIPILGPGPRAQPAATGQSGNNDPTAGIRLENYVHTEYAPVGHDFHETVLWCPVLEVGPDGTVELPSFTLSDSGKTYRVLIYGHSASGRLGAVTRTIQSQPAR